MDWVFVMFFETILAGGFVELRYQMPNFETCMNQREAFLQQHKQDPHRPGYTVQNTALCYRFDQLPSPSDIIQLN